METNTISAPLRRQRAVLLSILLAFILIVTAVQSLMADSGVIDESRLDTDIAAGETADLSSSYKAVDQTQAPAGGTVAYTIVVSNSGNAAANNVMVTDVLPAELTLITPSLTVVGGAEAMYANGVINWTGTISEGMQVAIQFDAILTDTLVADDVVANTVEITGTGSLLTRTAETTIIVLSPADLSNSSKTVNHTVAPVGSLLAYTIVVSNAGDSTAAGVLVTDTLPSGVVYQANTLSVTPDTGEYGVVDNVLTWTGAITGHSQVVLHFMARLDGVSPGQTAVNTAQIWDGETLLTDTTTTQVTESRAYLPFITKAPVPKVDAFLSRANASNQWTVSWTDGGVDVEGYEIQQDQNPNFTAPTVYEVGRVTSLLISNIPPSFNPIYYYRVRARSGDIYGEWSDVESVIGGYHDNFDNPSSGWAVRRMTYLEETFAKYGTGSESGNLIIIVVDRWDWLLASPLVPAPPVPYVIEYRARVHDASNLVSGGAVLGGDWNGESCPHIGNVYQTTHCFNHFYNFNYIFYGPLKLLHEQVDELVWCPNCQQSPIKRIGPTQAVDHISPNGDAIKWHTYRMEVRDNGVTLFVDGRMVRHFSNTNYVHDPYYGVFASTDEYKPSIWFYDYYDVMPLDE